VSGWVGRDGFSVPVSSGPAEYETFTVTEGIRAALADAGLDRVSYVLERSVLHLLTFGPAVEVDTRTCPGSLVLVEGAVPQPWRRRPDPVPAAAPALSADPTVLERTLRERLPDAIGATQAQIAAAEARLGVALPAELRALYRVTRGRRQDVGDENDVEARDRIAEAIGCYPRALEDLYLADPASRPCPWQFAAMEATFTPPDAAVQGLVGSPGWMVFGDDGYGDRLAIDLTPGPRGHLGQVIVLDHGQNIGADLIAGSLTDMVVHDQRTRQMTPRATEPVVAYVNTHRLTSIEAAAHPALEVLGIGWWNGEPFRLAPVVGLPRLRTLTALPRTLADPLEVAKLTGLEFLELGPAEWRVLLDAGAVPRTLLAAAITDHGQPNPLPIVDLANELLALWDRPPITRTILEVRT
jgi:cell wall assembly regulator SMI1